ncbi:hypothetical protein SDSE_1847 [Streptococcus dysgalactiae subsp. equisimilis AC-2713]|uniref:Uncharacterized protein n=1 Tax=Streptococcus dysgalactiae subsp. equisimilis AC-2713 TaxID=759913 RepID=A0AB33R8V5_STREQ|nr:hypothetical protein HMPREF9963_2040 [Streptococcus dysgalactiae subsp. equisimilis SK1250]CCI63329.1 hypothetical protein SDSE_1847 [Streptococcus dysgalactiae subsp. equisimilis AC-2713]
MVSPLTGSIQHSLIIPLIEKNEKVAKSVLAVFRKVIERRICLT